MYKIEPVAISLKVPYEIRNIHRDYWNPIARMASGNIVMATGNDSLIQTKHYDRIISDAVAAHVNKYQHDLCQILVDDGLRDSEHTDNYHDRIKFLENNGGQQFCSWIIITKTATHVFEGLCPAEITFSGADVVVYKSFNQFSWLESFISSIVLSKWH